jgi:hypothetical protein
MIWVSTASVIWLQTITRLLSAKAGEKNGLVYVATYYPGTSENSHALSLDLHAGDEVPVNIALGVAKLFRVRGQVANLPVEAREAAGIVLRPLDGGFTREVRPWPIDNEGKFEHQRPAARVL